MNRSCNDGNGDNDDGGDDDVDGVVCPVLGAAEVRTAAPDVRLQLHGAGVQHGRALPDVQRAGQRHLPHAGELPRGHRLRLQSLPYVTVQPFVVCGTALSVVLVWMDWRRWMLLLSGGSVRIECHCSVVAVVVAEEECSLEDFSNF